MFMSFISDAYTPYKYCTSALFGASRCAASRYPRASLALFARSATSARPMSFCTFGFSAAIPLSDAAASLSGIGCSSMLSFTSPLSSTSNFFIAVS